MSSPLVDLHCHLLPGVDDGAKNIEVTLELVRQQLAGGVTGAMLTPHFYYERDRLEAFAERRRAAFNIMCESLSQNGIDFKCKLGAEVYFSPAIPSLDLDILCFEGTNYILIELPTNYHPGGIDEVLYDIQCRGYTPIIAHVERYAYVAKDPTLLYEWVNGGALAHINASPLIRGGKTAHLVKKYIEWGLVHFVCSDAHSPDHRPANIPAGYRALGKDASQPLIKTAAEIFEGYDPYIPEPRCPKNFFGKWI